MPLIFAEYSQEGSSFRSERYTGATRHTTSHEDLERRTNKPKLFLQRL